VGQNHLFLWVSLVALPRVPVAFQTKCILVSAYNSPEGEKMSDDYWRARNGYLTNDPSSPDAIRGYHDRQQASGGGFFYNGSGLDVTKPLDDYLAQSSQSSSGSGSWAGVLGSLAPVVILIWAYAASGPNPSSKTQTTATQTTALTPAQIAGLEEEADNNNHQEIGLRQAFAFHKPDSYLNSEEETKELQKLFSRPFSKIYGTYTQGSLCEAFTRLGNCQERSGRWTGVEFRDEKGAGLEILTHVSGGRLYYDILLLQPSTRTPAKIKYYPAFEDAAMQAVRAFGMNESDLETCYRTGSSVGKDEEGKDFSCSYFPLRRGYFGQLVIRHEHIAQEQERKAIEAQEWRHDPELRKQRMETAFAQSSARMFGNQSVGSLCGAFSAFPVTCTERYATVVSAVDKIASKSASVSIIDRAQKSPLDLTVKRSLDDSAQYTLTMEGPGGNYAVRNYDPDVRAVAASVLDRFGLVSLDILNLCSDPPRDFTSTVNGNRISCSASMATNHRMTATISISGKEPSP
jgi:hypothetical protein